MAELGGSWWFIAAATAMVVVALMFVAPLPWHHARASEFGDLRLAAGRKRRPWLLAAGSVLAFAALASGIYLWLGEPGALNPQRDGLSTQLRATDVPLSDSAAEHAATELKQHLQRQPDDARARVTLARLDIRAQRFAQAAAGFERALQGTSKALGDAGVWVEYAEAVGLGQGGKLAGQPRALVDKALSLNPDHPQALDLAGSAAWEAGEFALAVTHWNRLLAQIPAGSPRHVQLASAIQRAEQRARFALPPTR